MLYNPEGARSRCRENWGRQRTRFPDWVTASAKANVQNRSLASLAALEERATVRFPEEKEHRRGAQGAQRNDREATYRVKRRPSASLRRSWARLRE